MSIAAFKRKFYKYFYRKEFLRTGYGQIPLGQKREIKSSFRKASETLSEQESGSENESVSMRSEK
jgi:hypothetical protein